MSDPARVQSVPPPEDDARVQLEGALELLEGAESLYRRIRTIYSGVQWEERLREHASLFDRAASAAGDVEQAFDRVERRASLEGWSRIHVAVRCAGRFKSERARLERVLRQRLSDLGRVPSFVGLADGLRQMGAAASPRPTSSSVTGEPVLAKRTHNAELDGMLSVALVAILVALPVSAGMHVPFGELVRIVLGALGVVIGIGAWTGTVYWLTPTALFVARRLREPVTVRLDALGDGDVELLRLRSAVRIRGTPPITVWAPVRAARLARLLEVLRSEEPTVRGEPVTDVLIVENARRIETPSRGLAVIRPDSFAFIPYGGSGAKALRLASGRGEAWQPSVNIPVRLVIEQLCYRGPHVFDLLLARIANACDGVWWPRDSTTCEALLLGGLRGWWQRFDTEEAFSVSFRSAGETVTVAVAPFPASLFERWHPHETP